MHENQGDHLLCGWLGLATDDPTATLARMAAGTSGVIAETAALAAHSPLGLSSTYVAEGLLVAVHGRPRFESAALAERARTAGPAAALADAWRQHGKDALGQVHGPFAAAVLEPVARRALLAIDRMGIERLCFAARRDGLVFGRSCEAVTAHPAVGARISPQGVFDYLYAHMVPSPGTVYADVEKLLPAQYLLWQDGRLEKGFYWQAHFEDAETDAFAERARTFRALLEDGVRSALDARPTGAFLSGGTDSSTVAGMLKSLTGRAETFSIGFAAEGYDETEYARIAVRHFGLTPHEYYVTPADVLAAIPAIARAYDEPFGNASAVPTWYCARRAREAGIEVMLAGDGGDEIFGGNARYAKQGVFELYHRLPHALRTGLIEPVALRLPEGIAPLRKLKSYVAQARIPLPDRLESYNFLHRDPLEQIFDPAFLREVDPEHPLAIQREVWRRTQGDTPINRMLHLDWKQTLADNDLRKVGRMTELAGVEVRYPLLDERLVAFAAALPPSYKVRGQKLRWFFKAALSDFLPPEILVKKKHGFGLPFGLWLKQDRELHALALASLRAFRTRGVLRETYLDRLIAAHENRHADYYGVMIWVVMMLEQWLAAHSASL